MSGTVRTPADLLANAFPDNIANAIGANDLRDAVESFAGRVGRTITANYTLQSSDRGTVLNVNSTNAPITITVPSGVFAAGNVVGLRQTGTGQIQLIAGSGVTLNSFNGQFISRAQNSRLSVLVATPTTFYIDGDLAAGGSIAPNAPTGLTSSGTSTSSVSLVWTAPATGAALDHGVYTVQYAPHGGTFTNFSPGVAYCTTNSGSITDSFGNVWAISTAAQAGGGITVNGVYDTPTANVTTLYLISGTLWQLGGGSWYFFTPSQNYGSTPPATNAWAGPQSASPLGVVVTGLTAGSSYDFRVHVSNTGGTSVASSVYTTSTPTSTGQFKVDAVNQRILDPSGAVWKGNGVNLAADSQGWFIGLGAAVTNTTACTPLLSTFPKTKIVRIPCYDILNATARPADFSGYINGLTAKKIVCSVEYHLTSMTTPKSNTSPTLDQVVNWYGTWAAFYAANPYVWYEVPNEINPYPDGDNGASYLACLKGVVNAVRAHSNQIVQIHMDYGTISGGLVNAINTDPWWSQQTNLISNSHFYHGLPGFAGTFTGSTQADAYAWMASNISLFQSAFATADGSRLPVINGEYGDSTDGSNVDPDAQVVIQAGTDLNTTPGLVGSTIWYWNAGAFSADLILAAPYDGSALTTSGTTFLNNMF